MSVDLITAAVEQRRARGAVLPEDAVEKAITAARAFHRAKFCNRPEARKMSVFEAVEAELDRMEQEP